MKMALILYNYFPYGGLQRDFLKIAQECLLRGHTVTVYTMTWTGPVVAGLEVVLLPGRGLSNHRRCLNFSNDLRSMKLSSQADVIVGFNKVSGLDAYFAADPCYVSKALQQRNCLYHMSARYHVYAALEREVFDAGRKTRILLLNPAEQINFVEKYQTAIERFHLMPPGIARRRPEASVDNNVRQQIRKQFGLQTEDKLLLMVGSGFQTKGVDRSIQALAALPVEQRDHSRLLILGSGKKNPLLRLARRLGVAERVSFLGVKEDVSPYYLAADLLLHPARTEAAGMVLIEALTFGLPVLVTDVCGYAFHVKDAAAGDVFESPFVQKMFSDKLSQMLKAKNFRLWKENGLAYAEQTDLYSLPQKAVDLLETIGSERSVHV